MASVYWNILSTEDIAGIMDMSEVNSAKEVINTISAGKVLFTAPLDSSVKQKLKAHMGIDLTSVVNVPMRWIKGDTVPHIDVGQTAFANTYLVYLTACSGKFHVGQQYYDVTEGSGFVFNEGLLHETVGMGPDARLLIGPMSEEGVSVGIPIPNGIYYYEPDVQALAGGVDYLGFCSSYTVGCITSGSIGTYSRWRIANPSSSPPLPNQIYSNGDPLLGPETYYLYPVIDEAVECCGIIPPSLPYETRTDIVKGAILLQAQNLSQPGSRPASYDVYYSRLKAASSRR